MEEEDRHALRDANTSDTACTWRIYTGRLKSFRGIGTWEAVPAEALGLQSESYTCQIHLHTCLYTESLRESQQDTEAEEAVEADEEDGDRYNEAKTLGDAAQMRRLAGCIHFVGLFE